MRLWGFRVAAGVFGAPVVGWRQLGGCCLRGALTFIVFWYWAGYQALPIYLWFTLLPLEAVLVSYGCLRSGGVLVVLVVLLRRVCFAAYF